MRLKFHKDTRICVYPSYNTAFRSTIAISMQNINSCLFYDIVKHQQDRNILLKCLGEVTSFVFKNNLGIILGSN